MATVRGTKQLAKALRALEAAEDPQTRLAAMRALAEQTAALERRVVLDARSRGLTWREIGSIYGMSKQAAQQRFRATEADAS